MRIGFSIRVIRMHIIFATEIWGRSSHVDVMTDSFKDIASKITVIDPYDGTDPAFCSEEDAYARYVAECGHEKYAKRVSGALQQSAEPTCLVGFSAGAGAVWSAVCAENVGTATGAVCFYGSSIRNMIDYQPNIPVDLVFSENEPHFDVETVARSLQDIPLAQCYITPFEHGFMNPLSKHYHQEAYHFWLQWIKDQVVSHCAS